MTSGQLLSLPAVTGGLAPASSATAWLFGSWVVASASLGTDIYVTGLAFQVTDASPGAAATREYLFEIGTGAEGAEVTKVQIPYSNRADTVAYGYYRSTLKVFLPESYLIPSGTRVAVRATDSIASAITYNSVKLLYREGAGAFVYGGGVALVALPSYASALGRIYGGTALLAAVPSSSSARDAAYDGAVPVLALPTSQAGMEKGYDGYVSLVAMPSALYSLEGVSEFVYEGLVALGVLPDYQSFFEMAYDGALPISALPNYLSAWDRAYEGDAALQMSPSYASALQMAYDGAVPLWVVPAYQTIMDTVYNGQTALIVWPNAACLLEGLTEFVYLGYLDAALLPGYGSVLEAAYGGVLPMALIPFGAYVLLHNGDAEMPAAQPKGDPRSLRRKGWRGQSHDIHGPGGLLGR